MEAFDILLFYKQIFGLKMFHRKKSKMAKEWKLKLAELVSYVFSMSVDNHLNINSTNQFPDSEGFQIRTVFVT
jgi:hypothetical protein